MASIEQLKDIRQQFAHNVKAAGAQLSKPSTGVLVKEAPGAGRFMSGSNKVGTNIAAANDRKVNARVQARTAAVSREQLSETRGQSAVMKQQLTAQQEQTQTMKGLHDMMAKFIAASEADRKKLSPKQQQMTKAGERGEDYDGGPKGEGVFDALGGALNDFMTNGLDLFGRGRGRDRGGRNARTGRNRGGRNRVGRNRVGRNAPNTGTGNNTAGKNSGGLFNTLRDKFKGTPGKGKAALITGLLAGVGAVGYSVFSDDDVEDMNAASVANLVRLGKQNTANGTAPVSGQYANMPAAHNGVYPQARNQYPAPDVSWASDQKVYNHPTFTSNSYTGLGAISAANESGGKGVHAISTGRGDAGGVSYGKHQLASNNGSMDAFLRSKEGAQFAQAFNGTKTGSAGFNARYSALAATDGENLAQAQQEYTTRTHYQPQLARVSSVTGVDFGKKGRAVQEMLYSTGVQYGPNSEVVINALKGKDVGGMTDADLIKSVQAYKQQTVGAYFKSSSADVQRSVAARAMREGTQLLALNARDVEAAKRGEDPMKAGAIGNIKITNGFGAQALASGSTANAQAANMYQVPALISTNGVMNDDAFNRMMAGSTGKFTIGADEAGEDIGSVVASGGLLVTGRKHVKLNHARVNMQGLHPKFLQAFYIMVGDWVTNHGGDVCCVESAFRTRAEQEVLWNKYGQNTKRVARPGTSRHETGFAIDIDRKSAGAMDSKGLMRKYGFHRPLSNEPWHVEMTAAARNKPIATDAEVNVSSVTPDALSASQEAEVQQQVTGSQPTGPQDLQPPVADPSAGAEAALDSANTLVKGAVVVGGAGIVAGAMLDKNKTPNVTGGPNATDAELPKSAQAADDALKAKPEVNAKPVTPDAATKPADVKAPKSRVGMGGKALPVIGTAITAYEAGSIITDDTMSREEKQRAGSELAGGTAGAVIGGKAGAAGGAALGAAIGSVFFGVGAVPGAAVGGVIGGIGGSIAGYFGGSELGGAAYDAVAGEDEPKPETGTVDVDVQVTPSTPELNATQVAGAVREAAAGTNGVDGAKGPASPSNVQADPAKIVDSTSPKLDVPVEVVAGTTALAASAMPAGPSSPVVPGSSSPATGIAGSAMSGLVGAALSAALPTGWGDVLVGDYAQAQAVMAQPDAYVPAPAISPVKSAASSDSPASSSYYSTDNVALQPSTLAPSSLSPVTAQSMPAAPSVSQTGLHVEPVERQQHEPVKSVIALNANKQDTMMPERFKPKADRIPASGVAQANSSRQTLDDCPVLIGDGGLVLLQTGFI